MDMDFTIESAKAFDATVDAVVAETEAAGFRVLHVHDVSATLAEKGFDRERVSIVEVCNAKYAAAVLAADAKIGLLLPCPVMVYAEGGWSPRFDHAPDADRELLPVSRPRFGSR